MSLRAHLYEADPDIPADFDGKGRCGRVAPDRRRCGLPPHHPAHTVPDTRDADAAHRRRTGEKD